MSTTPTERRLEITPGEARIGGNYAFHNVLYVPVRVAAPPIGIHVDVSWVLGNGEEARHTASLHADAHNTYNACGLTPSELLAKLRQARELMNAVLGEYNEPDVMNRTPICYFKKFSAMERFIANLPK